MCHILLKILSISVARSERHIGLMKLTSKCSSWAISFPKKVDGYRKHRLQTQCSELKNDPLGIIKWGLGHINICWPGRSSKTLSRRGEMICVHRCACIDCSPEPQSSQLNHLKKNKKSEPHWPDTRPIKVKSSQSWPTLWDPMDCM